MANRIEYDFSERRLIEHLAALENVPMVEVFRRALDHYAYRYYNHEEVEKIKGKRIQGRPDYN